MRSKVCVHTETERERERERECGQACRCVGGDGRVCALAVKCSRTGCRRRVQTRESSWVQRGHVGRRFFKDPACYGSVTEARNVNKRSAVRLDVWNSRWLRARQPFLVKRLSSNSLGRGNNPGRIGSLPSLFLTFFPLENGNFVSKMGCLSKVCELVNLVSFSFIDVFNRLLLLESSTLASAVELFKSLFIYFSIRHDCKLLVLPICIVNDFLVTKFTRIVSRKYSSPARTFINICALR